MRWKSRLNAMQRRLSTDKRPRKIKRELCEMNEIFLARFQNNRHFVSDDFFSFSSSLKHRYTIRVYFRVQKSAYGFFFFVPSSVNQRA